VLKPIRMEDTTSFISLGDDAIDWDSMVDQEIATNKALATVPDDKRRGLARDAVMSRYSIESLKDPARASAALKLQAGKSPCKFIVGAIPSGDVNRIVDECIAGGAVKMSELKWRSFCSSLRGIEGWGSEIPTRKVMGVDYVDPDWIAKTFVRGLRQVALDVGMVCWAWNQLTDGEQKN
jgi:hypothetical protein